MERSSEEERPGLQRRSLLAALGSAGGLALLEPLSKTARAATPPTGASSAADASRPAAPVTTDALAHSGASQQRWLSVPESRVVLNPYDFNSSGSELSVNSGPELPLRVGYYTHDKAYTEAGLLQIYRQPGIPPAHEPPQESFTEDFDALDNAWQKHDVTTTSADGRTTVKVNDGVGWGYISREITVDLDKTPLITLTVAESDGQWALKVNDGSSGTDVELQQDTDATGSFTYGIASASGWRGSKTFQLKLFTVGSGKTATFDRVAVHSGTPWAQSATSFTTTWRPEALEFTATYPAGKLTGYELFHDATSATRVVKANGLEGSDGGALAMAGRLPAAATYDADGHTITVQRGDYTVAIALPAAAKVGFFLNESGYRFGNEGQATPQAGSRFWAAVLPGTGTQAVGIGYAQDSDAGAARDAAARARAAASVRGAAADRARWTSFWNSYLAKVPAPQDFSIHAVDPLGVTPDDVKYAYYQAFVNLEENILPATPETGNAYPQLSTGKPSLWLNGTPGTRSVASWDSLLGMHYLVYTDPKNAWLSFEGMMALVEDDGALGGESLPSRKAQTAWLLYSVTGDRSRMARTYGPLARHLHWESENLRWILHDYDYPDERDAEFVVSLMVDLTYAVQIAETLGKTADVDTWKQLRQSLMKDYQEWFFPGSEGTIQKRFLEGSHPDWEGLTMYVCTGLHIDGLPAAYVGRLQARFDGDYDPDRQFVGLAEEAIKAPDAQFIEYGLLDHQRTEQATVFLNALTRDMVRSGWFAEVYQESPDGLSVTPIARGVRPSLFGIANLIDNVWISNGYRSDLGGKPAFVRLPDSRGGIARLTWHNKTYNINIDQTSFTLDGAAVDKGVLPGKLAAPLGVTTQAE
ncbi:hypothetical protein ACXZ65_17420 [Streptomyces aculeolatus]